MIETIAQVGAITPGHIDMIVGSDRPAGAVDFYKEYLSPPSSVSDSNVMTDRIGVLSQGAGTEIHEVMLSLEIEKLQLGLIVEVRNRLLEGYQEIIRMPV